MKNRAHNIESNCLQVNNLDIDYLIGGKSIPALRNISFDIAPGETLGLVGESGSGKSTIAYSIVKYLASNGRVSGGSIQFKDKDIFSLNNAELLKIRGSKIALVPQDPLTSLNPSHRIGAQISEILDIHFDLTKQQLWDRTIAALHSVHIAMPETTALKYPHQISGGQQQRVLIAMAFCTDPELLVMDEPTTGLDVTTQARILDLINEMKALHNTSILYITHDLGVSKKICDKVTIIYAGEVVEQGTVDEIFSAPAHPYTQGLIDCIPPTCASEQDGNRLSSIEGFLPNIEQLENACIFAPRCPQVQDQCHQEVPPLQQISVGHQSKCFFRAFAPTNKTAMVARPQSPTIRSETLLEVKHLKKSFPTKKGSFFAVDGVDFKCNKGEILGIVGESGCGKTTIARMLVGLEEKTSGSISFNNRKLGSYRERGKDISKKIQMVFQNPEATLNPQKTIEQIITRPLALYDMVPKSQRREKAIELLNSVNLGSHYLSKYPHEISGGEKQRVGIARAFATDPELIILDEPISSLDVSVQANILNLLQELREKRNITYIFIGHNLGVIRHLCDRIMVIYKGKICEMGTPEQVFQPPYHPYTETLLAAIPVIEPDIEQRSVRVEDEGAQVELTCSGCAFHQRCRFNIFETCQLRAPPVLDCGSGHDIACHAPLEQLRLLEPVFKKTAKDRVILKK